MKLALIAAVVLLALAQGSSAQDTADLEKLGQYLEDVKTKMTQEVTALLQSQDLANQAQTFVENRRAELEPLASKIQEQMMTATSKMQEQLAPLASNVREQFQPLMDNLQTQMEALLQKLAEQTRAIGN